METADWKKRIENPEGWYLFCGEEDFLKRYFLKLLRERVVADEFTAAFNYQVFDGPVPDVAALAEAVKAPPMMADYKIVVWKYADFEKMREDVRRDLDDLLSERKEYPYSIVVFYLASDGFDPGTLPKKPSKLYKKYAPSLEIIDFPRATDPQLLSWLKRHFDAERIAVNAEVLNALIFRSGHAMDVLAGEVDKLCAFAHARGLTAIGVADVEAVASSTPECDTFALSNAILTGNATLAFRAIEEMKRDRTDPAVLLGMLTRIYTELLTVAVLTEEGKRTGDIETEMGLNPFRLKLMTPAVRRLGLSRLAAAVDRLGDIDLAAKSGGTGGFSPLEAFLVRFL